MAEHKKPKSKEKVIQKEILEAVRPQNDSVGEMLRVARTNKGMSIEDVSASIHIRNIQLKAIEEGHIEVLPGMTYAVGFVRSYANFLGLNGAEVVHKFKAEHGHSPAPSKLSFPVPVAESRMPDPMIVGVGAFLAIVVLVAWTVYSNVHNGAGKLAGEIPPAPAVAAIAGTTDDTATAQPEAAAPVAAPSPPVAQVSPASSATVSAPPSTEQPPAASTAPAVAAETKPSAETAAAPAVAPEISPVEQKTPVTETPVAGTPAPAGAGKDASAPAKEKESVITIKGGKGHIVLKATHSSWVQVMGPNGVIYSKVLRPGEQYYVPDQPGLSLLTANAGGLDISVDGRKIQPLGKIGEIVRGVVLDPKELKQRKSGVGYNQ